MVTAGPCREPLDPVRYISNRSSGKMGYALAQAAADLGADTTLVSGPTNLVPPSGITVVSVETTQEMFEAVKQRFGKTDILIMAAAPSDFKPSAISEQKIKKQDAGIDIRLEPTTDILMMVSGQKKAGQIVVGFALETEKGEANARKKLKDKNLDLIVLNNPLEEGAGFEHDTNRVTLIRPARKAETWPVMSKAELSVKLLAIVSRML